MHFDEGIKLWRLKIQNKSGLTVNKAVKPKSQNITKKQVVYQKMPADFKRKEVAKTVNAEVTVVNTTS